MKLDFGSWAFGNSKLVYFLIAVLLVGGVYSAYDMSKLEDPEIKVKLAMVAATYPGASAHQVELEVTDPLEKSIRAMGDVSRVSSYSYDDFCVIEVELNGNVKDGDIEQCWDMLRRKVADVSLPSEVTVSVQDDFGLVYGMFYAITGDGFSDDELDDYAEFLKRETGNIDGVARVNLYGKRKDCINISLTSEKLAALGVSPLEILSTLNGQNATLYSGYYDNGDRRIRVAVGDKFRSAEQIGDMIIQGHEDDQLRLRDIAVVEKAYEDPQRTSMQYNGARAVGMAIAAESGTDIMKVGRKVEKRMEEIAENSLPAGIECHKVFFQPQQVGASLTTFAINLIESVLIVIAILMLTMGFRSGLMIGISLVIIVVGSFLFLGAMDGTMQRVSLASFIFAMGMLVDNAIVITDGILVALKRGTPRREAMTGIGRKTAMPLLGATIIAILSFLPIALSPDTAGVYIRDLFIVLAVSLLLSWILALVHVPLMADRMFRCPEYEKTGSGEQTGLYDGRAYRFLRKAVTCSLNHKLASVLIAFALVGLAVYGFKYVRRGFFPDMTYNQLYMEYKLPEGTSPARVAADLTEIRQWLQERPEITNVTTSLGGTPARYNLVRSIATPSLSYGELIIDFTDARALERNVDEIQNTLTAMYPDAYVKLKRYNIMYKKYPIEVVFTGPDPSVLQALADSAQCIMRSIPEICLVTTDRSGDVPVLNVAYNQVDARSAGVSRSDVAMSMMMAGGGLPVSTFYNGSRQNTIYVKCVQGDGTPIDDLENVPVMQTVPNIAGVVSEENLLKLKTGTLEKSDIIESVFGTRPVRQVSDGVDIEWESPVVPRYNGQRSQTVMCSPVSGVETESARVILEKRLNRLSLPEGYSMTWQGEKGASDATMKSLFANIPIAVILIIAILILLFKDYRKPLVILCCIPLLGVGIVGAMLISGKTFTFCAIVGAIGLVGMMMKNCIVLMDEINSQIASGKDLQEALVSSSQTRFRAVMMASFTTILGMIPLVKDAMFGSMAVTIMGGLLFSTIATLFFVPLLYSIFFSKR